MVSQPTPPPNVAPSEIRVWFNKAEFSWGRRLKGVWTSHKIPGAFGDGNSVKPMVPKAATKGNNGSTRRLARAGGGFFFWKKDRNRYDFCEAN